MTIALIATMPLAPVLVLCCCSGKSQVRGTPVRLVPEGVKEEPLELGRVSRMGFITRAGDEVRLSFTAGEQRATLWLAWGVDGGDADVVFNASLRHSGTDSHIVLNHVSTPGAWTEATADLTHNGRDKMELVLRSECLSSRTAGPVYWATPIVATPGGDGSNILLICIDSLRADHLGCYGYSRPTSPTLDSLASVGCVFTRAVAQSSWTLPSMTSLLTSVHVASHGVYGKDKALGPGALTLAEVMRQEGYLTAAFITAPTLAPAFGLAQGFDLYDAHCTSVTGGDNTHGVTNPCLHERALERLRAWGNGRFFFVLHYWDVHYDYVPPPPYDTLFDPDYEGGLDGRRYYGNKRIRPGMPGRDLEHLIALYDGEIAHTDRYLSMLFRELRRLGLAENTVVIVTSDHGDEFLEHGARGHGHTLFQELIHVPLIWAEPPHRSPCGIVEDVVRLVDIGPTIMDLVGIDVPVSAEGTSLVPLLRGVPGADPRPAVSELTESLASHDQLRAILLGESKIIHSRTKGWVHAYRLSEDPKELRPCRPESIPHGLSLRKAITSFGEGENLYLQVRVIGGGRPASLALAAVSASPILGVEAIDAEPEDATVLDRDHRLVEARLICPEGDVDGFALRLGAEASSVEVDGWLEGERMTPDQVLLGSGEHPSAVPFSVQCEDRRLLTTPERPPAHAAPEVPLVYVWTERPLGGGLAVERDRYPDDLAEQLRELGYLR